MSMHAFITWMVAVAVAGTIASAQSATAPAAGGPAQRIEARPHELLAAPPGGSMFLPLPDASPRRADAGDRAGWVLHKDPLGFTVRHPRGWKATAVAQQYVLIRSDDGGRFVFIWPFLLRQDTTAEQCVKQVPKGCAKLFPAARIERLRQRSKRPDEVLASLSFEAGGQPARATVLCSIDNRSGMIYAIAAGRNGFEAARPVLVDVLRSFSFTQPQAGARTADDGDAVRYVRWQDPKENAFSLDVPAGWRVGGGMFRFAPVDVRPCVQIVSPDGRIRVSGGDSEIPTFSIPFSPFFPEGSDYSPGYGVVMKVRRYVTGLAFAKEYAQYHIAKGCTDFAFTEARDRPDAAQYINELNSRIAVGGIRMRLTMGEVAFTCRRGGENWCGYCFAGTTSVTYPAADGEGGIWKVDHLHGFLAAADRVDIAQAVLNHGLRTTRVNPQWFGMQQGIAAESGRIVAETHAHITKIISDSYWRRQAVYDDLSRKRSNSILGLTDVVDPETGETYKVASGHNYYWRKEHTDVVVGTDTYERPDIDFTPLTEW